MASYSVGDIRGLLGEASDLIEETKASQLFRNVTDAAVIIPEKVPAKNAASVMPTPSDDSATVISKKKTSGSKSFEKPKELTAEEKLMKDKCTLFVGNVPMGIAKRKFEAPFKTFGKIVSSRFRSVPVKEKYQKSNKKFGVMKKDFVSTDESKLSQNGYIVFGTEESVKSAIEGKLHGTDLFQSGHMVRLDYVVKPVVENGNKSVKSGAVRTFDRKKSIYIPHLPANVCDVDVTAAVESVDPSLVGTVRGVRIVRTPKAGTFAFVLFSERCHATKATKVCPSEGFEFKGFGTPVKVKLQRIMKEDELANARVEKQKEIQESAKIAAKKSLSRMKWQARLTRKGVPKVVSHHAMPRKERQEKMKGAALRLSRKKISKK